MWKYKETYFVIIEPSMFNTPIPVEVTELLGYGDVIKYFGEIVWIARELTDGRWACSIQLMPKYKLPVQGVKDWITKLDYNKAKQLFKTLFDNVKKESQFKELDFKEENIIII